MADAIQGLVLVLVCVFVIIQGTYETGGAEKVYTINRDNGKCKKEKAKNRFAHTHTIQFERIKSKHRNSLVTKNWK